MGIVYDEGVFRRHIAKDLPLAAGLDTIASETVAVGVGLSRIESLSERTGPNSRTYPFIGPRPKSAPTRTRLCRSDIGPA